MRYLLVILMLCFYSNAITQSFEGTLTYRVDYVFSKQLSDDIRAKIIETLKEKGEYFDSLIVSIKDGNYIKIDNAPNGKKILYRSESNKLYFFTKSSNVVLVTKAESYEPAKLNLPKPRIRTNNSLEKIGEYDCKLISLTWEGFGQEEYYYSDSILPINPSSFQNHNYEYLNLILNHTKHYPIKIVKKSKGLVTINMQLINIDPIQVSNFEVPELKKASKKDSELVNQLTGYDVMVIKN